MTEEAEVEVEAEAEPQPLKQFTITNGDITLLQLHDGAIVNPSNTGLILSSGISEQIARRAGPHFQQKLHTARSRLPYNRLDPGRVLESEPGQLTCKCLLHVSIVGKKKVDKRLITNAILNVYDKAEELGLKEIAFPALGVGIAKFPIEDFIELFWQITTEELPRSESLQHVVLCLFDEPEFEIAEKFITEHQDEIPETINLEMARGSFWGSGI